MSNQDKLLLMYERIHGKPTGSCYLEVTEEYDEPMMLHMMKGGVICWSMTKTDVLFDYITKDME